MFRRLRPAVAVMAVGPPLTGCTALWTTRETVRADEPRRPVTFETPAVGEQFGKLVFAGGPKQVAGNYTGPAILPVYLTAREGYLAENARFNDAVAVCDANRDGLITAAELAAFEKLK